MKALLVSARSPAIIDHDELCGSNYTLEVKRGMRRKGTSGSAISMKTFWSTRQTERRCSVASALLLGAIRLRSNIFVSFVTL
jgi:hypothetical protein